MSLLDSIIANQGSPRVVSEQHDASKINWVAGLSDPGEMIGCGMYQELRRHAGETDVAYAERLPVELAKIPSLHREKIEAAMKAAALKRASLATVNGKVAQMTAGQLPWHGLGVNIEAACGWEDAVRLASLGYGVSKLPLYYFDKSDTKRQSPSAWSIVRDDTGEELGSVGKQYKIIQNEAAFKFLDSVIGEFGARFESAGALYNGSSVFGLVHLPKQSFAVNGSQDEQKAYAMFMNVHDGSGAAWCFPTSVRAVCANTVNVAMREKKKGLSIRHTGDIKEKVKAAREALGYAVHGIEEYKEQAETLYRKPLNDVKFYVNDVLDAVLDITQAEMQKGSGLLASMIAKDEATRLLAQKSIDKKIERREEILEDILNRYEGERCANIRGTAFGAWNAITEHVDHGKVGRQAQDVTTRQSRRFESVLLGEAAEMKQTAFEIALKA